MEEGVLIDGHRFRTGEQAGCKVELHLVEVRRGVRRALGVGPEPSVLNLEIEEEEPSTIGNACVLTVARGCCELSGVCIGLRIVDGRASLHNWSVRAAARTVFADCNVAAIGILRNHFLRARGFTGLIQRSGVGVSSIAGGGGRVWLVCFGVVV